MRKLRVVLENGKEKLFDYDKINVCYETRNGKFSFLRIDDEECTVFFAPLGRIYYTETIKECDE